MKDYAAIDFETANSYSSSVCSVGLVVVRNSKIVDRFYSLIQPEPNYYSRANMKVHGLSNADTDDAEIFPFIWKLIEDKIGDLPLVAHYSRFDEGCLRSVFRTYGMTYPDYRFYCTCTASRRILGKRLPDHRLPTVATYCGYNLSAHHHALADAEACAHIWLYLTEGLKLLP